MDIKLSARNGKGKKRPLINGVEERIRDVRRRSGATKEYRGTKRWHLLRFSFVRRIRHETYKASDLFRPRYGFMRWTSMYRLERSSITEVSTIHKVIEQQQLQHITSGIVGIERSLQCGYALFTM